MFKKIFPLQYPIALRQNLKYQIRAKEIVLIRKSTFCEISCGKNVFLLYLNIYFFQLYLINNRFNYDIIPRFKMSKRVSTDVRDKRGIDLCFVYSLF